MKKIYLDYNIYLDFLERGCANFFDDLKVRGYSFFYSPAHVEEVVEGYLHGGINKVATLCNLTKIGELSEEKELFPYFTDVVPIIESPFGRNGIHVAIENPMSCFNRVLGGIGSNSFAEDTQESVLQEGHARLSLLNDEEKNDKLSELGRLTSEKQILKLLNENFNLNELKHGFISLIAQCDASDYLHRIGEISHPYNEKHMDAIKNKAIELLHIKSEEYNRKAFYLINPPIDCFKKIKGNFKYIENMVDLVLRELNRIGYKLEPMDKVTSSLHDHTHVIYATACDYFICGDSKLAGKAKAAYTYLGVPTQVINASNRKNKWWDTLP